MGADEGGLLCQRALSLIQNLEAYCDNALSHLKDRRHEPNWHSSLELLPPEEDAATATDLLERLKLSDDATRVRSIISELRDAVCAGMPEVLGQPESSDAWLSQDIHLFAGALATLRDHLGSLRPLFEAEQSSKALGKWWHDGPPPERSGWHIPTEPLRGTLTDLRRWTERTDERAFKTACNNGTLWVWKHSGHDYSLYVKTLEQHSRANGKRVAEVAANKNQQKPAKGS